MYVRVPDLYSVVVQVGAAAQCREDGGAEGLRNRCPAAGAVYPALVRSSWLRSGTPAGR
jgi:hypothetical protein